MNQQQEALPSDKALVAEVLRGEKRLFGELMHKYNRRIFRVCLSVLQDDLEAEEAMQAAYVRAYEHLAQFRFEADFATWLTRIALNECYARLKKRRRLVSDEHAGHHVPDMQTPYNMLVNHELRALMEASVNALPEIYRTVFVLREIEGASVAETATCLDLSESNVKVRLSRAKEMLRDQLSDWYKSHDLFPFHLTRCNRMVESVLAMVEAYAL